MFRANTVLSWNGATRNPILEVAPERKVRCPRAPRSAEQV
jgi:hypothetical protein